MHQPPSWQGIPPIQLVLSSLGYRCAQDLRPEESALRPLNHLLVHALWRMVHDNSAGLVVDLRIHLCVTNEVDDPFLTFRIRQTEPCRQVPSMLISQRVLGRDTSVNLLDINPLVDFAVAFGYQMPSRLDESISTARKEEIHSQHLLRLKKLPLRLLKVKVHV
jgi:hypothetical protein